MTHDAAFDGLPFGDHPWWNGFTTARGHWPYHLAYPDNPWAQTEFAKGYVTGASEPLPWRPHPASADPVTPSRP